MQKSEREIESQVELPLLKIHKMSEGQSHRDMGPKMKSTIFKEDEEATKIAEIVCLRYSLLKIIFVVPIIAVFSGFLFLIALFWRASLRKRFLYQECLLGQATHL